MINRPATIFVGHAKSIKMSLGLRIVNGLMVRVKMILPDVFLLYSNV